MVNPAINVMFGLFNLGGGEIILILALVLILFGAKKLPELAKGLGTGIKEFKKATREVTDEIQNAGDDRSASPNKSAPASPAPPGATVSQSTPPPKTSGAAFLAWPATTKRSNPTRPKAVRSKPFS